MASLLPGLVNDATPSSLTQASGEGIKPRHQVALIGSLESFPGVADWFAKPISNGRCMTEAALRS
jgi:hypothetical protein